MSPCQFFISGEVNSMLVAATALANATPLVGFAGEFVTLRAMATALVGAASVVRLLISTMGMVSSRDHALLRTTRSAVSEMIRPVIRSPLLSSRETLCAQAPTLASHRPARIATLLLIQLFIRVCDARWWQITQ
jgi:hypothetical protein